MMNFDFGLELLISAKMLISLILGGVIGIDRERHAREVGIRTYAAITIGATLFTSVAAHMQSDVSAASRIVANVVTGVGFLGVGVIYKDQDGIFRGLTTAATVWCTAAIGVAVGLNMFVIAIGATAILYGLISLHHWQPYIRWKAKLAKKHEGEATE